MLDSVYMYKKLIRNFRGSFKLDILLRKRWRWKSIKVLNVERGNQTYIGSVSTKIKGW